RSVIAGMRIAVVVKQVPAITEMALDEEGRLIRAGLPLELNPYCRRAVAQAVELACAGAGAGAGGGAASVTIVTLGPPSADDALREAIAWGLERGVEADGLLVTDPAFAGSDTLATARVGRRSRPRAVGPARQPHQRRGRAGP